MTDMYPGVLMGEGLTVTSTSWLRMVRNSITRPRPTRADSASGRTLGPAWYEGVRPPWFGLAFALDQFVDLHRKLRLERLLLRIRQAEIGKNIAAAFLVMRAHDRNFARGLMVR